MSIISDDIAELHLLLGVIQNVDVGLVVLDREYRIKTWNSFMENHSGMSPSDTIGQNLFLMFPELPEKWLRNKLDNVFLLKNRSFSTWQQRPYLMKFDSYRPITGRSELMYQNMSLFPLASITGEVEHVCLMIYDVTDAALDEKGLQDANAELDRLGRTDGLTGLYNRRAWEEYLEAEYKRFRRSNNPAALVMFDIDHFKRVNDTYGHQAGDEVIRTVARLLLEEKRESDIAGRYGGEEFGVILVDTDSEGALQFTERLRTRIENSPVHYEQQRIDFTISLGVSELASDVNQYTQWLEQSDQALYQSKEGGRNQSSIFQKQV